MDCNNKQILFLLKNKYSRKVGHLVQKPGMRIRIRSDPLIFGLPDPDPLLFSTDPDPTCNNGYIRLFSGKFLNKSENSYWWTAITMI